MDNKYPRAIQGLRTDWTSFFMFPFVILSRKQRIKRYNLQFGGKGKLHTSLQSLKTSFFIFFLIPKSWKANLTTCTEVLKSRISLLNLPSSTLRELKLTQQVRYSKSLTVALHKSTGGLKPSLGAACLSLHTQHAPEVWGRWQFLDPIRKGTSLSTNNLQPFCRWVPAHNERPLQGSLWFCSSPALACSLQRWGVTCTEPEHGLVFPSLSPLATKSNFIIYPLCAELRNHLRNHEGKENSTETK